MKKIILLTLITVLATSCTSSLYNSYPIEHVPEKNTKTTVYYSIPQETEIIFEVKYLKTIRQKGIYAHKSNLLGLKNVINTNEVKYAVKDIEILSQSKQTPIAQFALVVNSNDIIIEKSPQGTLESIIIKEKKETHHKHLGEIAQKERNILQSTPQTQIIPSPHSPSLPTKTIYEQRLLEKGMLEKINLTPEKLVERIDQIRERQIEILAGGLDGTYINTTVDFMYKQLDEIIDGYISLFTGTETTIEETHTYTLTPQKPIIAEEDLILTITNTPLPLLARFHTNNQTAVLKSGGLTYNKKDGSFTVNMEGKEKVSALGGIYYAIPEMVQVSVETPSKTYTQMLEINQYGLISTMKTQNQNIILNPKTGAIKSIR